MSLLHLAVLLAPTEDSSDVFQRENDRFGMKGEIISEFFFDATWYIDPNVLVGKPEYEYELIYFDNAGWVPTALHSNSITFQTSPSALKVFMRMLSIAFLICKATTFDSLLWNNFMRNHSMEVVIPLSFYCACYCHYISWFFLWFPHWTE